MDFDLCGLKFRDTVKPVYKDRPREMLKTVFRRGRSLYEGFV